MLDTKKKKAKMLILIASIWFVASLPLPWLVNNPDVPEDAFLTVLGIIGFISIPFIALAIAWTLKPDLTT